MYRIGELLDGAVDDLTHSVVVASSSVCGLSNVITCESEFSCICFSTLLDCSIPLAVSRRVWMLPIVTDLIFSHAGHSISRW